jgi:ribonuclease HI
MDCTNSIKAMAANSVKKQWRSGQAKRTWSKPKAHTVKLNVDASFSMEEQNGACGAILRNSRGEFIAAQTKTIPHAISATMAEAMAMLHGLTFANSLGYNHVEAESDSLEVIQLCSGAERIWNEAIAIYADILTQVGFIGNVEFMHTGRDTNAAAHELARNCFDTNSSCIWVDEPPSFMLQVLLNDVTVI